MGLEGKNQQQERGGILRHLGKIPGTKETMLAASLLGSSPLLEGVHSDKAYAVEILQTETWYAGAERIFQSVDKASNEAFAIFIRTKDGKEYKWAYSNESRPKNAGATKEGLDTTKQRILELSKKTHDPVEVCVVHTHYRAVVEGVTKQLFEQQSNSPKGASAEKNPILFGGQQLPAGFNEGGIIGMPPSRDDVGVLHNKTPAGLPKPSGFANWIAPQGVQIHEREAVFDTNGIWYFQRFSSESEKAAFIQSLESKIPVEKREEIATLGVNPAARTWMKYANGYDKGNLQELFKDSSYVGLQYAYARQWDGFKVEFVSKEEIANRQPCSSALKQ